MSHHYPYDEDETRPRYDTIEGARAHMLSVPGVVLVGMSMPGEWLVVLHVRGGDFRDVRQAFSEIQYPVHIRFELDHAQPKPHHLIMRDNPWLVTSTRTLRSF